MDSSSDSEDEFQRYYMDVSSSPVSSTELHSVVSSDVWPDDVLSVVDDDIPGPSGLQDQRQTKQIVGQRTYEKTRDKATEKRGGKAKDKTERKVKGKKGGKTKDKTGGKAKEKTGGKATGEKGGKAKGKKGGKAKEKKGGKAKEKTGETAKQKTARKANGKGKPRTKKFTKGGVTGHIPSHVAARREERVAELRRIILGLDMERMRDVLLNVVERESGLVLDLLNCPPQDSLPPSTQPGWCVCRNCRPMQRDIEALCCGLEPENCLSRSQYVLSMMDPFFNGLQRRLWRNMENREGNDQAPGAEHNRRRWQVYRSFTLWQHGRLGLGNRVVVPSCVVCRVRDEYPDPNNHYTGFIAANL